MRDDHGGPSPRRGGVKRSRSRDCSRRSPPPRRTEPSPPHRMDHSPAPWQREQRRATTPPRTRAPSDSRAPERRRTEGAPRPRERSPPRERERWRSPPPRRKWEQQRSQDGQRSPSVGRRDLAPSRSRDSRQGTSDRGRRELESERHHNDRGRANERERREPERRSHEEERGGEQESSRRARSPSQGEPSRTPGEGDQYRSESFKDSDDNEITIEIADGVTRVTGDVTYQVQMHIPRQGGAQRLREGQKPPTVCIRGPSRVDRSTAEDDAHKLKSAFLEGGIQKVRKVRAALTGRGGYDVMS
mmetsp:Transcript_72740/g.168583  ORF Transcript_72740/g.168583 Transcript_72740/m.168583 type:complete len:302 (-) Transcript_72740:232-1137(-)|eukprot:CAMPEP_0171068374 /NCGR_PEP_ID=MMETSP0766_2-20121228/8525_1 /TAXON_ID=439317 /ORGANISM="Gambierdiscus australes, Strain CAWD 149" /LENGTH=301 /DNA_ID=CAMNT_0011524681 /DNA_START=31 /DNA_END=936 /DNA_ORIENTATION=-